MKKSIVSGLAAIAVALAAPAAASSATLAVDPAKACYHEGETVFLTGSGYTPNTVVAFTRDGAPVRTTSPVRSDPAGNIVGANLSLPRLQSGQLPLTYVGTDTANGANSGHIQLLVSAIDVSLKPEHGAPNRVLRITGRGFTTGNTLWVHIKRNGKRAVRTLRIGRLSGACRKISTKRRLFSAGAAPGVYRVQFDTYRSYKASRPVAASYDITVYKTVRPPR